ncbi:cation transporter [Frankia sp. KB5]|uniref:cation transporter n=1 Tax=Frankia sp. KB5 TaxID=683318 RepID=UPI000A0FF2CD|nr:cation transporter [Frankia sp. KB5]ORT47792.1 cation transporter [Frankia sp. KB5]
MATVIPLGPSVARREALGRCVRLLVLVTITYNAVEAVVALAAGILASSAALVGFGLDSIIEMSSAAAVAWQFSARDDATRQRRERAALRVVAGSFVALAVFVAVEAARALTGAREPEPSAVGILLAATSLVVMPFLSAAQRRAGRELGSASAVADSKQTLLCTYLSAVLLAGLVLHATFGWTAADSIAALVIASLALREARDAWRGEGCCSASHPPAAAGRGDAPGAPGASGASDECGCACCP